MSKKKNKNLLIPIPPKEINLEQQIVNRLKDTNALLIILKKQCDFPEAHFISIAIEENKKTLSEWNQSQKG